MYNEAQKLAFIDTISHVSGRNACRKIFNNSEKFEKDILTDLSAFDKTTMVKFLNSVKIISLTSLREYSMYISKYIEFCNNSTKFDVSKDDIDFVGAIKNTMFSSPSDLIREVNFGIDPNKDSYAAAALYLAWCGVEISEALELKNDQVNLDSGVISLNGNDRTLYIDREILAKLIEYKSVMIETRTQGQTYSVTPQTTDKFLYKMVSKNSNRSEVKRSALTSKISEMKIDAERILRKESRLSYQNALRSGRMYRLYRAELSGVDISHKNKKTINSILCSKGDIFDNLFQYRKYKEAFGLQ